MRILQLTPGTGSFYCGTCVRDNALVTELRRQGHDALLVPLYLPAILDEPAATPKMPILFGGINVYLQQKSRLFRRTPRWVDRLFDGEGLLRQVASRAGMTSARELGELTLSTLRGEEGKQLKELERLVEWLRTEGRPDVVCLSNILLLGLARRIREGTGAAVVCTLQGEDSFLDSLPEPERTQAWDTLAERARDVDAFVAVSRYYGDLMQERAKLPPARVHTVHCGITLEGYEERSEPPTVPTVGYLARLSRLKGLERLVSAYEILRERNRVPGLRLHAAGTMTAADEPFVAGLQERLAAQGYGNEVEFRPNLEREEKIAFLRGLSVFSVPTTYGESFGLYLLEAMAAGVPVVQPRHAAFPEVLKATGGGLLCGPDDSGALAAGLESLLLDPEQARRLGNTGREAVHSRFSATMMARGVLEVFDRARKRAVSLAA
ncbi:MAG: glycosyltransferase family 4 protein [Armatimonadetes bacterium]|nr:glycosyltransferase family 4 protein [Armatimonadota bacterium]